MLKNIFVFFVFFLLALLTTQPAFAGGQLVSLHADTNGAANNNGLYLRIIRVYLHPEYPCKGTEVTFKLVDQKDGDYTMTGSGNATFTFQQDRQPYYKNGVMGTTCSTYAKMGSKIKGVRQVTVGVRNGDNVWSSSPVINVDFDGEYHTDNETNGYSYRSSIEDPYFSITSQNTAIIDKDPTKCQPGPCTTESIKPVVSITSQNQGSQVIPTQTTTNSAEENLDSAKNRALEQKVASLETKIAESEKKQSALEQTLNNLLSWIKSRFWFFK